MFLLLYCTAEGILRGLFLRTEYTLIKADLEKVSVDTLSSKFETFKYSEKDNLKIRVLFIRFLLPTASQSKMVISYPTDYRSLFH